MGVTIRSIEGDEWDLWRKLRLQALAESPDAFRSTLQEEGAKSDEWWATLIRDTVAHPRGRLWVAETEGDAVGMLFGRLSIDLEVLHVGAMWAAPRARQLGVGTGLLQTAMEWARDRGATSVELWVTEENAVGRSFYTKAGFRPTTDTKPLREGSHLTVRKLVADL